MKTHIRLIFAIGLILSLSCFHFVTYAIQPEAARKVAEEFMFKRGCNLEKTGLNLRQVSVQDPGLRTETEAPYCIFNIGDNQGFVIVSDGLRLPSVLAYADEGGIDSGNMPTALTAVLNNYSEQLLQTLSSSAANNDRSPALSNAQLSVTTVVSPLIAGTKWNQGSPYNNLCPSENSQHTLTGCVAVALGQIMRFHQYPQTGTGSHSYTHSTYGTLSANFGQTTYDWSSMLDSYSSSATNAQISAVTTLLYQLGVATDMKYTLNNSTTTIDKAAAALSGYFGYDPDLQACDRIYLTNKEWINLIKSELNQNRPLYYSGVTKNGEGHAFVCDGYDSQDFFHINWGWGGVGNGYFDLKSLSYQYPGTEGAAGGFSMYQSVIVGIQKNDQISKPSYFMRLNNYDFTTSAPTLASKNINTFASTFAAYNQGTSSFTGKLGVGYRQANGAITLLKTFGNGSGTTLTIDRYSNYPYLIDIDNISLKDLTAGTYTLFPVYKPSDSTAWSAFRGYANRVCSLTATILPNGSATIQPVRNTPDLALSQPMTLGKSLYYGTKTPVDFSVTNSGKEFSSFMGLALFSSSKTYMGMLTQDFFICPEGETHSYHVTPSMSIPEGSYYLAVVADSTNSGSSSSYKILPGNNLVAIQILPKPGPSNLVLTQTIRLVNGSTVRRNEDLTVQANLTNTGGLFNNQLIVYIFPTTGGSSLTSFTPVTIWVDSLENKTVELKGQLSLDDGEYMLNLYQNTGSEWAVIGPSGSNTLKFTVNGTAGVQNETLSTSWYYLENNQLRWNIGTSPEWIQLIDLMGRIRVLPTNKSAISLENLPKGVYLLRTKINGKIHTGKVLIQ